MVNQTNQIVCDVLPVFPGQMGENLEYTKISIIKDIRAIATYHYMTQHTLFDINDLLNEFYKKIVCLQSRAKRKFRTGFCKALWVKKYDMIFGQKFA